MAEQDWSIVEKTQDLVDYVYAKYGNSWKESDEIFDEILDDLYNYDMLVPSCFVIYDLELLSLSFDFVFSSEIFKSLSFRLDRLCRLAILCLDQHAHTLHHLESLLTISLDRLDIFEGRSCLSEFVRKSLS
ncbi:hypothetical protein Tco_0397244 [Tanacetum coccineum]